MLIRDLFARDVTRDIPPVVYFHEQSPDKLAAEVSEYIITGGFPPGHPGRSRVPSGIHEEYVRLLTAITDELRKPGGPDLPNAWISGFYGSGKSSFAKLLGLALDGVALPGGRSLAEAWLARDTSALAPELRAAWQALREKVDPIAVVFDVGSVARAGEHVHAAALRQVQRRLGYCPTEPLVADYELSLERDGEWPRFLETAEAVLGKPWDEVKTRRLAEEDFSLVLSVLYPERYTDPMSWYTSRGGTHSRSESPDEAALAIADMLRYRSPRSTLFLVVDEVSQYVLASKDRVDRLRAFATALGPAMNGRAWLLALGQQKLDESSDDSFLVWAKDRFPPRLRVHLSPSNIRDVVHQRLLEKTPAGESTLRSLFEAHRPDLKLFAFEGDTLTAEDFVETYPMLPGHLGLLLKITSALRVRSSRAQGDDQAIRGLLQLLGELFRARRLADEPVGALVTLDQVYEIQHTALDSDAQASMARVLEYCAAQGAAGALMLRAAKAVALLELIAEELPADGKLVAQCLYARVDLGNQVQRVTDALEALRAKNLLGYSEKQGYKIQSSEGEEWERERRDLDVASEVRASIVQKGVRDLLDLERPKLQGRAFPVAAVFSDGRQAADVVLVDPRDEAVVRVDFRYAATDERSDATWVRRSDESALKERLLWVVGDKQAVDELVRELGKSRAMADKYRPRRDSLTQARKMLLQQEEGRREDLEARVKGAIAAAWMDGRMYFRGRATAPLDHGVSFAKALEAACTRYLPELFSQFVATTVQPSEMLQLIEPVLSGPSPKFLPGELGILELDGGHYVPACSGGVPTRILEQLTAWQGVLGAGLLAHFAAPPFGYTRDLVKACVAGLLRGGRLRIRLESGDEVTAVRDAGVRELFEKDRAFRRAEIFPAGEDDIGFQARAKICKFFEERLRHKMDRDDDQIANAVDAHFKHQAAKSRDVQTRLAALPGHRPPPEVLVRLDSALEDCLRNVRKTKPTVTAVKRHLGALHEGLELLGLFAAELTQPAIDAVRDAASVRDHQAAQLQAAGALTAELAEAAARLTEHLARERPWREIGALQADVARLKEAYVAERERRLGAQEAAAEAARVTVKGSPGFSTLTADQAHQVLRPIAQSVTSTSADAIAPSLVELEALFAGRLRAAVDQALDILDGIRSAGDKKPLVVKCDLKLRNREVTTEAEVEALVEVIRKRLLEHVHAGKRVRLV